MGYADYESPYGVNEAIINPRLSALEWSAVAVARHDELSTLHEPSRMAKAMGSVFGRSEAPARLADEHLEALRRAAVYAWHGAPELPDDEVVAFHSAGFSSEHYDLLVRSTAVAEKRAN